MISSLTGTVQAVTLNTAVIDVNGFGMLVNATPGTLSTLHVGRESTVFTSMVVREDSMTLFGFASADERDVFEVLISVSGIGPRTGLAILAVHSPEEVRIAANTKDTAAFTKVSGIGPKGASRIVLELNGKLVPTGAAVTPVAGADTASVWEPQVIEALTGLGWSEKDATSTLKSLSKAEPEIVSGGNVAEILRAALRSMSSGTRV
ncbi:Holliday junction branch migration protein RuvA [Glutamicibacter mishrai]|uniref:Holliday junction branch migration complex subunit RuvA n=1 Tax=Glutamicibacter mishrai TaxID=1775880 RepID=A0A6H0SED8_9MICC|nr:Holliday junction branch migration protein RuvA [Glutamicibacter mishrai]KUM31838.1 Holliday junction ATP-dependent DNA helicase RuvA [Arthrobacter sp. EpRS66]QIV85664.1 Holliday junction branch migration protein RuvA [Glutamicibacter mishrai]UTT38206.1 Holliday junction branch migration protein RuvA [Glutamicibacter mishrai]